MLRYCIDCKEVFGCISNGIPIVCFESESDHCTELGSCLQRIQFDPRKVTGGICNGCMTSINVRRILAGKRPIGISAPQSLPTSA